MALDNIGEAGQIKRKIYQRLLPEDPSKDYYYILRETGNTEPLLIEYGFIDNSNDAVKLKNNLEDYVEGVVKALAEYVGYTYQAPVSSNYYTVVKGDTLYGIASRYNMTVQELKDLNNLTTNTISVGQKLLVNKSTTQPTYTVVKGDTLYSIANKYNTTVSELKNLNNLTSNTLSIGQQLLIPTKSSSELPNEPETPDYPSNDESQGETQIYTVKKGDSLWLISKKYNTTVDELTKLNNLTNINLQIGDQLLVPKQPTPNTYIVKSGDTLWSIAKNNNTTIAILKELNNLTNNLLTIGQELILPK